MATPRPGKPTAIYTWLKEHLGKEWWLSVKADFTRAGFLIEAADPRGRLGRISTSDVFVTREDTEVLAAALRRQIAEDVHRGEITPAYVWSAEIHVLQDLLKAASAKNRPLKAAWDEAQRKMAEGNMGGAFDLCTRAGHRAYREYKRALFELFVEFLTPLEPERVADSD